jgi:antitoxin component of RelBE/YafQ-DinJ toxin-antitoxin module
MELFLRRMVVDQRIPFDVVAIDPATYTQLLSDWERASKAAVAKRNPHVLRTAQPRARARAKRE